jgi:peptidoglycan/LPS O-acetylase OafA/YrhL
MGVIATAAAVGAIVLERHDLLYAFTYLVNYKVDRGWFIGHLWSLSVEEQFYLLWPFAFSMLGRKRGVWLSAAFVLMGPTARILGWLFLRHTPYVDLEMFPMVADSLAAGCLLAVAQDWLEAQPSYLRLFKPVPAAILASLVLVTNRYMSYTIVSVLGGMLINLALAILIHRSVYCYKDAWGRFLNSRPIVFVGLLSYSLYLWQQPFLNRRSAAVITRFPLNIVLAVCAALLSYFLLEKPLMNIRKRLRALPA